MGGYDYTASQGEVYETLDLSATAISIYGNNTTRTSKIAVRCLGARV